MTGRDDDFSAALRTTQDLALAGKTISAMDAAHRLRARPDVRQDAAKAATLQEALAWYGLQSGLALVALAHADEAVRLWRNGGSAADEARARAIRAWLCIEVGHGEEAAEEAFRALNLCSRTDDEQALGWVLNVLGVVQWSGRQLVQARDCIARAVEIARHGVDPVVLAWWLINLGGVHHADFLDMLSGGDDADRARSLSLSLSLSTEAQRLSHQAGDVWGSALAQLNMMEYLMDAGEVAKADRMLRAFQQDIAFASVESDRLLCHLDQVAGGVLLAVGHPRDALVPLRRSLATAERIGNHDGILTCTRLLSKAHEALEEFREALILLRRAVLLDARLTAAQVQERARMAEILLGLRTLQAQVMDANLRREETSRTLEAVTSRAETLIEETRRDPLTGIGNRRGFDAALTELATCTDYAVAMIDLDRFKRINDRYSHATGDAVLRGVADILAAQCRVGDVVARYGGEEFVLLMPGMTSKPASWICQRLRRAIQQATWECDSTLVITASFGIADRGDGPDVAARLRCADRRLYRAKAIGRNRVIWRDPDR